MFIPLHDANSLKRIKFQYVTIGLIAVNVLVYLLTTFNSENFQIAAVLGLGYIPSVVFDIADLPPDYVLVPEDLTYLTYAFLHSDLWHLGGNMLFLWVFGDNIEDAMGHMRFIMFFLMCGIFAAVLHAWMNPGSELPLIGASGAVAGAVYFVTHALFGQV